MLKRAWLSNDQALFLCGSQEVSQWLTGTLQNQFGTEKHGIRHDLLPKAFFFLTTGTARALVIFRWSPLLQQNA